MSKITPAQKRRIEKFQNEVAKYWYADFSTKEIKRKKPVTVLGKLRNFFWKKRHSVFSIYWWCKKRWFQMDAIPFTFPMKHDSMPIEGFPLKYRLMGGWTIPESDLKYLSKGPLATEDLSKILVQHELGWQRFLTWFNQLKPIGTVVIFVGICVRYWPEILKIWDWIKSAL